VSLRIGKEGMKEILGDAEVFSHSDHLKGQEEEESYERRS
jgi:hypothetical protein